MLVFPVAASQVGRGAVKVLAAFEMRADAYRIISILATRADSPQGLEIRSR